MPIYALQCSLCAKETEAFLHSYTSPNPACACGGAQERIWRSQRHIPGGVFPYITTNLDPTGKPVEVRSHLHLQELCKQYGVVHRDDVAWIEQEYQGVDFATGKQRYSEGSGRGLPGQWV